MLVEGSLRPVVCNGKMTKDRWYSSKGCHIGVTLRGRVTGGASLAFASSTLGSGAEAGMAGSALLSQSDCAAPGASLIWVALMFAGAAFSWNGLSLVYATTMSFVAPGGMWPSDGVKDTGAKTGNSNLQCARA